MGGWVVWYSRRKFCRQLATPGTVHVIRSANSLPLQSWAAEEEENLHSSLRRARSEKHGPPHSLTSDEARGLEDRPRSLGIL